MHAYLFDWLNLLLRWAHVIVGIAWIGASFYFVWLDNHLEPPRNGKPGVGGEVWSVHGGGFYHKQKYLVAPAALPERLHWFKWEAYFTWMTGAALLAVVYYAGASAYMVDRTVADIPPWAAVGIGVFSIVFGWVAYEGLCASPLAEDGAGFGLVGFVGTIALAAALGLLISGRAVYIHIGAMWGTIMVANVFFIIIPGQRRMVAAMIAGEVPDPIHGKRGKQRSMHNNYMTLPVVFLMISNHYPMTYGHPQAWAVLAAIMVAGFLVRHFFNLKARGRILIALPSAAIVVIAALAIVLAPAQQGAGPIAVAHAVPFGTVEAIVRERCVTCHAGRPAQPGFASAPAGVMLDRPERIVQWATKINQQAVVRQTMPAGNLTGMTDAERNVLGAWFLAGAKRE